MKYLTYSGNDLVAADLGPNGTVLYPHRPLPGLRTSEIPEAVRRAFDNPLGMSSLKQLVGSRSKVLIVFDDNCQPFPLMQKPDFRQTAIEALVELLVSYGVQKEKIELLCAVALHRKMKKQELAYMLGPRILSEFYPRQIRNFDAEDPDWIVHLGETEKGEIVETDRAVVESDLVIYIDTNQIPLNGGHKSVAVGLATYRSLAHHHAPQMTCESPHVMQPDGSCMHASIERISRVISKKATIMVLEAPMNAATYPPHLSFLAKSPGQRNPLEKAARLMTPGAVALLPESVRRRVFRSIRAPYQPLEINAGAIDPVHERTLKALRAQLCVKVPRQFSTLVFGLPDLSPYAIGARLNPVLVVSDVLGYVFNWFYNKPFVKKGGVVIILNPVYEIFHEQYHASYKRFWDEVLPFTSDPFEMQEQFQEKFATDSELRARYRDHFAHHGFHPFTVWYWATYPLRYLSKVILVGPSSDLPSKRLGVGWAPSLSHALAEAKEITGDDDTVGLTIPPFLYLEVEG